jgi:hypothetical protein
MISRLDVTSVDDVAIAARYRQLDYSHAAGLAQAQIIQRGYRLLIHSSC